MRPTRDRCPSRYAIASLVCAAMVSPALALGAEFEVAGQGVATLTADRETRGGGAGYGLEFGVPLLYDFPQLGSTLLARERTTALVGAGLAWSVELGATWRARPYGVWQPELGLSAMLVGGALIRSIDAQGHEARDPVALMLGLSVLRFRFDAGWANFFGFRAGPTLFRAGAPPFACSLTFFEVGRSFEL